MKVVYNCCYGGFSLSHIAIMRYAELKGISLYPFVSKDFKTRTPVSDIDLKGGVMSMVSYSTTPDLASYWSNRDVDRADPILVQVVEELGEKANGSCAMLAIENVEAGQLYRIDEYDGNESVMLQSEYDWKVAT